MAERERGKVKWFNNSKGYGFIERAQGDDIFVHYSAIQSEGYRSLKDGQAVEYTVSQGAKGLQAEEVVAVEDWCSFYNALWGIEKKIRADEKICAYFFCFQHKKG